MMQELHWLRPWWLLALVPLGLMLWQLVRHWQTSNDWERIVDPVLAPYVLETAGAGVRRWPLYVLAVVWLLTVLILSGPTWEKLEMPVYAGQDAQVLVLDLSRSMDVDDLKPSRLSRAKFKVADLLERGRGMQVGLIVFSEVPYVVSPLTDDVDTLAAFLPALTTSVVPVQGGRPGPAIERAQSLLQQAGVSAGTVILLTDSDTDDAAAIAAQNLRNAGYRLSVLGVGTENAEPIRGEDGNFLQDDSGKIVLPRLEREALRQLASIGGGVYADIQSTSADLDLIDASVDRSGEIRDTEAEQRESANWIEYAPWLLPLVLLMMLFMFRRGVL